MSDEQIKELKSLRTGDTQHVDLILQAVCVAFGITREDLTGKRKDRSIVDARMICAYLLRVKLKFHLRQVAEILGRKDHSTVCNLIDRMDCVIFQHDPVVKVFQGIERIIEKEIVDQAA